MQLWNFENITETSSSGNGVSMLDSLETLLWTVVTGTIFYQKKNSPFNCDFSTLWVAQMWFCLTLIGLDGSKYLRNGHHKTWANKTKTVKWKQNIVVVI